VVSGDTPQQQNRQMLAFGMSPHDICVAHLISVAPSVDQIEPHGPLKTAPEQLSQPTLLLVFRMFYQPFIIGRAKIAVGEGLVQPGNQP